MLDTKHKKYFQLTELLFSKKNESLINLQDIHLDKFFLDNLEDYQTKEQIVSDI